MAPLRSILCVLLVGVAAIEALEGWDATFSKYNPSEPPREQTLVRVNTYVRSIRNINSVEGSYEVQLTFRQQWSEAQLAHTVNSRAGQQYRSLNASAVWKPDLFFSNELEGHFHELLAPNSLVRVYPDGNILLSQRVSLKLSCPMNLRDFPFDSQTCSILIASYGFTTEQLILMWKDGDPVQITKNLHLSEFTLNQFNTSYCTSRTNTGEYSCLRVDMLFTREWRFYLIQVFIPMTMLVTLAWLTFWVKDSPVRVTILMFTLTMAVIGCGALSMTMPRVSYTTKMNWFTGVGLSFIFAAVVEFIVVRRRVQDFQEKDDGGERLDAAWRLLYPLAYLAFIAVYSIGALLA